MSGFPATFRPPDAARSRVYKKTVRERTCKPGFVLGALGHGGPRASGDHFSTTPIARRLPRALNGINSVLPHAL